MAAATGRAGWAGFGDDLRSLAGDEGVKLAVVVVATVVAVRVVRLVLARFRRRLLGEPGQRATADVGRIQAVLDVLGYLGVAVVVIVGALAGLSTVGVDTGALLASAGVLGFAVGFGAQTMVKDLLSGLFLLAEGQYTIGDKIAVNGVLGVVERVTLRTTTLRASNGDVHIIPSGDVRLVTNKSKGWTQIELDLPLGYDTPVERASEVLNGYCVEAAADPGLAGDLLSPPRVLGVEAFLATSYTVRVVALVTAADSTTVERKMRHLVRAVFEREGIKPPPPPLAPPPVAPPPV